MPHIDYFDHKNVVVYLEYNVVISHPNGSLLFL